MKPSLHPLMLAIVVMALVIGGCASRSYAIYTMTGPLESFHIEGARDPVVGVYGPLLVAQWQDIIDTVNRLPDVERVMECLANVDGASDISVTFVTKDQTRAVAFGRIADGRFHIERVSGAVE